MTRHGVAQQRNERVGLMLRGEAAGSARHWPERLRPALGTRGFATQLRDFLLRGAERGLDGRG